MSKDFEKMLISLKIEKNRLASSEQVKSEKGSYKSYWDDELIAKELNIN